jgi:dTDP-4-dehydrorhamnose 3,5-epimerase-like enzyme
MLEKKKQVKYFIDRGILVPIEFADYDFDPKRIFWVRDTPKGQVRGMHAHYETKQIFICMKGEIYVELTDGSEKVKETLKQNEAILIDKMVKKKKKYLTGDDVALVICSTKYESDDYISDYDEFMKVVNERK